MAESFEILSEILDKLIETQVQNAKVTADLRNAVEDNTQYLKELRELLIVVNGHFSNGFRQELKDKVTEAVNSIEHNIEENAEQNQSEARKTLNAINDFTNAIKNPRSWIGAFLLVASIFGTVAGIVTVVLKLMGGP